VANKIHPATQIPQPTTIMDEDDMEDIHDSLLEQKESKSTDIGDRPKRSPAKEKKKKKKTVTPEKAAKKIAKKAWEYVKKELAKQGPDTDGTVGPADIKELSLITNIHEKLAGFTYSSAEYITPDQNASKLLLALDGMQKAFTALTNFVNTAIVTSGSAKLATGGMFNHADVDWQLAVYWGKWNVCVAIR
jgi:hypothetical protein